MDKGFKTAWGVIGAGSVCEVKSVPNMYKTPNSEVKTVMRRDLGKAADFANRHNIKHWTNSLDEILNDPEINAVYIATPPDSHAELTIKAAQVGKMVYVEKPMANTVAECETMIQACELAQVPLYVAYYRRTLPGFLKVKELIDAGKLGDIRFVNIEMQHPIHHRDLSSDINNWRVDPNVSGGGYFHDLASHQLDFLDFVFGPISKAEGICSNQAQLYTADDIVTANFKFENGVLGTGIWCFTANRVSFKDSIRIVGTKGHLSFNSFGSPMIIEIETELDGKETIQFMHPEHIQQYLVQTIVENRNNSENVPSTGYSGLRTTKVMEWITGSEN